MKLCDVDVPVLECRTLTDMLSRIGDKWSIFIIVTLEGGGVRFNELRRQIGTVSQKMLTSTLRNLERDGYITRTVTPSTPPRVDYALTDLGRDVLVPVRTLANWALNNGTRIAHARAAFDAREQV